MLVDHAGARTVVIPVGCLDFGGTPWRDGAAVAGYEGLAILGADGAIVAQSTGEKLCQRPVALANAIAVPGHDDVVLFKDSAWALARIPRKVSDDALFPFRGGVLVLLYDEDADETAVSYWDLAHGAERVSTHCRCACCG